MAVRRVLELGDPQLRQMSQRVEDPASAGAAALVGDLLDTLREVRARLGFGRAISAPQVGELSRLVVMELPGRPPQALFNPEVVDGGGDIEVWDDCLSFPALLVRLRRRAWVEVAYQDESGAPRRLWAEGGLSELLQHEIDHLDGVLAVDRAATAADIYLRSEWQRQFGGAAARGG
ncbi:MAG: peptide deformylase [Acetobacteraceae bacterium]|nr:peptide deformylase [Acetobacteraceae bacterium]